MPEITVTTRNLVDTDVGPLRRFTGILANMPTEKRVFGEGSNSRETIQVQLNFKDIEVQEATEPYHFPIFTIRLSLSNRKKSRWGAFGESYNQIVDQHYVAAQLDPTKPEYVKSTERMDLEDSIGKRLGIVLADGEDGRPPQTLLYDGRSQVERPTSCWQVYSVQDIGVAGTTTSAIDIAMDLLNHKSLAEFNIAALKNPTIRGDIALLQAISKPVSADDSFSNTMVASGIFTKDGDGVYHRVT